MQAALMKNPRNDFWAITTYFNLTNGSRRRNNYHCFRRHLSVPLLTVEWHPDRNFQLADGDADILSADRRRRSDVAKGAPAQSGGRCTA